MKTNEFNEPGLAESTAVGRLQRLRGELADLAFTLEKRGRLETADVVNAIAARVSEIEGELTAVTQPNRA